MSRDKALWKGRDPAQPGQRWRSAAHRHQKLFPYWPVKINGAEGNIFPAYHTF
jgi:hypothetical protein